MQFDKLGINSQDTMMAQIGGVEDLDSLVFDPDQFKLSLLLRDKKITFQAIDNQSYGTMELVLERCVKEKPDLVLLPLVGSKVFSGLKEVDEFID